MSYPEQTGTAIQYCPTCHNEMIVNKGYVVWCDSCNWNLNPLEKEKDAGLFAKVYLKYGMKFGNQLLAQMKVDKKIENKPTISTMFCYLIASLVHFTSITVFLQGVWLVYIGWGKFFIMLGAAICFIIAWVTRPQFGKVNEEILRRDEYPTLYKIVDDIADQLGAKRVNGLTVNFTFNAAYCTYGIQGQKFVHLGLPLLAVLEPEEKVALIAHELGHGVNGDSERGFFVGTAIDTLMNWHEMIRPDHILEPSPSLIDLAMVPVNLLLLGLSKILYGIIYLLVHLLWYNKQRAEYLADYLATTVSGVDAKIKMLEKLHLNDSFEYVVQKVILSKEDSNVFELLRNHFNYIPANEIERVHRIANMTNSQLDSTHPPTSKRIEFLSERGQKTPGYTLSDSVQAKLQKELHQLEERQNKNCIAFYKANADFFY